MLKWETIMGRYLIYVQIAHFDVLVIDTNKALGQLIYCPKHCTEVWQRFRIRSLQNAFSLVSHGIRDFIHLLGISIILISKFDIFVNHQSLDKAVINRMILK